jgi:hypothetical protein
MRLSVRISFITFMLLKNVHGTVTEEEVGGPEYEISNFCVPCNV